MTNLLKGPYLQWPTTDAMTVMWETAVDQIGEVEWFETEVVPEMKKQVRRLV